MAKHPFQIILGEYHSQAEGEKGHVFIYAATVIYLKQNT
jgi:hypothetical protein